MTLSSMPLHGTVYGVLLNSRAEWLACETAMQAPPYKGAPQAPVLYLKTANTWTPNQHSITVPSGHAEVEIGATLGLVLSAQGAWRGFVLLNDLSLPHNIADQGFYRPPVKYKCLDGFLGVGPQLLPASDLPRPNALQIEVRVNGELRQQVQLNRMRRALPELVADVSEFMTLRSADVLMLGLDVCDSGAESGRRPRAGVGDTIEICVPSVPGLGVMQHRLVGEGA
jgi:5-oxopent-3-ene-1,2,5-tricarboxylate decarboxylase/2-hydroxyhepta-2,4-diene-1,7-dioate isomerase